MRVVPLVFLLAALADGRASVQEPVFRPYGDDLVFHSSVDLVALNVSVTDPQRQFVANLARENFEVFENGQKQDVLFFAAGRVPVTWRSRSTRRPAWGRDSRAHSKPPSGWWKHCIRAIESASSHSASARA